MQQNGGEDEDDQEDEYEDISDLDEKELEKLNKKLEQGSQSLSDESDGSDLMEEEANYYKENIFNKEDYYLYRAIMLMYAGEYEKSI